MSIDFHELFAREGLSAPPSVLDTDHVVRRGHRIRARRRIATGAVTAMGVGTVAIGSLAVISTSVRGAGPGVGSGGVPVAGIPTRSAAPALPVSVGATPGATSCSVPSSVSTSMSGSAGTGAAGSGSSEADASGTRQNPPGDGKPPAELSAVRLPDPAPGFAYRREPDSVDFIGFGGGLPRHWVATFGLRDFVERWSTPTQIGTTTVVTSSSSGPEATVFVSDAREPVFLHGGKIHARDLPGTVAVAGVTGHLAEYTEMCATSTVLYFSTGRFTVEVIGHDATTDELVALGNALTGLR